MGFWNNFGTSAADIGLNVVGGIANGYVNQMFADHARAENFRFNELAANNADARQRAQFHDLYSYPAQVKQMKEAGLNPALMYGGTSGQGGASAPQGMGAGGVQNGYSPMDLMSIAQIENINADTEVKEAEKGLLGQQEITQKLNNYLTEQTLSGNIYKKYLELNVMSAELQQTIAETEGINWQNAFNKATEDEQVKLLVNKNANLLKDLLVKNSQIKLNDKQAEHFNTIAEKWQMDIYQKWVELDIHQESVDNQNKWFEDQVQYLTDQLEQDKELKGLDLKQRKTEMWVGLGSDLLKTVVYGGTLYATGGLSGLKKMPTIGFK